MDDNAIVDHGMGMGMSTDQGSGQGVALHSTMMAVIGGPLSIESVPEELIRVSLCLPQGG